MVDGLERPGYEIPVCSQQVQKKGRTWDDATTAEDTTMEVVEAVSLEKAGVVPGVRGAVKDLRSAAGPYFKDKLLGSTGGSKIGLSLGELDVEVPSRKRRATNVSPGAVRDTGCNMESGGTGSRFQLLTAELEEVKPVDPVSLGVGEKNARDKVLDKGVVVGVTSGSSVDGNVASGTSPSLPVQEGTGRGTNPLATGCGMAKGGSTGLVPISGESSGHKGGDQRNNGRVAALGKVVAIPTALGADSHTTIQISDASDGAGSKFNRRSLNMELISHDGGGRKGGILRWHQHISFLCRKEIVYGIPSGESFGHLEFRSVYRRMHYGRLFLARICLIGFGLHCLMFGCSIISNAALVPSSQILIRIWPGIREKFWKGLAPDWVKVNVDASVYTVGNRVAVGGLIQDDSGGWLRGFYRFVGRCSVLLADLWAIYDGLNLAWDVGFRRVDVDSDNMEAVCIINRMSPTFGRSALVQSIWSLIQRDWLVKVSHVPREENVAADKLATLGRGYGKDGRVFVVPPGVVASIVGHDQRRWMEERSRGADVAVVESDAS
ncbi:hypothetical protein V6N11_074061 [Hibiscus sabdariffa]|uniref:RNase H type-1 domain-containing protein n=1 Tax=Hibiscus sabdariffa TaxID=183260 RepID=A0ABR1Z937_9ROSI